MHIKSREITLRVVDEIKLTPQEWDSRCLFKGNVAWREHMTKILNLRVTKLAPQCTAADFYKSLFRFSKEIGFGEEKTIVKVTEQVYGVKIRFEEQEAA